MEVDPARLKKFWFARSESREYAVGDLVEAGANIGRVAAPPRVTNGSRGPSNPLTDRGQ